MKVDKSGRQIYSGSIAELNKLFESYGVKDEIAEEEISNILNNLNHYFSDDIFELEQRITTEPPDSVKREFKDFSHFVKNKKKLQSVTIVQGSRTYSFKFSETLLNEFSKLLVEIKSIQNPLWLDAYKFQRITIGINRLRHYIAVTNLLGQNCKSRRINIFTYKICAILGVVEDYRNPDTKIENKMNSFIKKHL